jgi:tetratricopeptide (TPR) repeat protein
MERTPRTQLCALDAQTPPETGPGWGRLVLFGLAGFTVAILPVAGVIDMYFLVFARVSDHFAYLPLIIIAGVAGLGISRVRKPYVRHAVTLALLAGLTGLSMNRARVYASDEALWADTVQKNPKAWTALNNLACNFAERGELDKAMEHFEASLALNPANGPAHGNYAKALTIKGRREEAARHFQQALELKPEDHETRLAYGRLLAESGRFDAAERQLRSGLAGRDTESGRLQLAQVLTAQGKLAEAADEYGAVLRLNSECVEALNNLAWIRASAPDRRLRDGTQAVALAQYAAQLTHYRTPIILGTLAAAHAEAGNHSKAMQSMQTAWEVAAAAGDDQTATHYRAQLEAYRKKNTHPLR